MNLYGLPPDAALPAVAEVIARAGHGFTDCCPECATQTAPFTVAKEYPGHEGGILVYECVHGHHWTCAWSWAA